MNVEPVAVPPIDAWPAVVALKESPAVVAAFKAMHLLGVSLLTGTVLAFAHTVGEPTPSPQLSPP